MRGPSVKALHQASVWLLAPAARVSRRREQPFLEVGDGPVPAGWRGVAAYVTAKSAVGLSLAEREEIFTGVERATT